MHNCIRIVVVLLISTFVAIIVANRSDTTKERNDTNAYYTHYKCIESNNDYEYCRGLIGSSQTEFIYDMIVIASTKVLGENSFYYFKFLFSLSVSFSILYVVSCLSEIYLLSLLVMLCDFRFWEYSSNVLRHGLALAIFMAVIAIKSSDNSLFKCKFKFLALFAHISSLVLIITPVRKLTLRYIVIIACFTIALLLTSNIWLELISSAEFSSYKLAHYISMASDFDFKQPIHYWLISIVSFYNYIYSDDKKFIYMCNLVIVLSIASLLLGVIGYSYRMTSFMLPFIAIILSYNINIAFPRKQIHNYVLSYIVQLVIVIGMLLVLVKNETFFLIHLS